MRVLGNNILIAPLNRPVKSAGGVDLPQNAKYAADGMQFRVLAVGPGRVVRKKGKPDVLIPIDIEPGDFVLMNEIHGNKFKYPDGRLIVEADEIIAKWRTT
jgi:co-chaperonin GroES (HSP10)